MGSRPECLLVVRLALRAVGKRTGLLDRLVGGLENLDTALDVRGVGEDGGTRDRAHVVCEERRAIDAAVLRAIAAAFLVGALVGVTEYVCNARLK